MKIINKKIIVGVFFAFFLGAFSLKAGADDPSSEMTVEQQEFKGMLADTDTSNNFTHQEWNIRNPFQSEPAKSVVTPKEVISSDLVLQGVFLGSSKPSAIINKTVVGIGSTIDTYTVKDIEEGSVVVVDAKNNSVVLSLKK